MKIIVGLGNPGKKYENTRHNVGFLSIDKILQKVEKNELPITNYQLLQPFKSEKKFEAEIAKIKVGDQDIVLVKPQTFMNLSGNAVKKIVDFYKINPEKDLIVIYDDIDIEKGKVKIRFKGTSAGHNGLQSIIDALATDRFMRIRIGIGRPDNERIKIEDWVLQELPKAEKATISFVIEELISEGIQYLGI